MSTSEVLRGWFEAYLEAFNGGDFDGFGSYYADDVIFQGQAAQVVGRTTVLDFYREVKRRLDERLELLTFVGAPAVGRLAVEMRTTLIARQDWLELSTGPIRAGERRQSVNFIFYDIADGRFTRIRSARFSPLPDIRP